MQELEVNDELMYEVMNIINTAHKKDSSFDHVEESLISLQQLDCDLV